MPSPLSDDGAFRLGCAALGLFAGLFIGFIAAFFAVASTADAFRQFVFGGALLGLTGGFAYPAEAWRSVQVLAHFLFGFAAADPELKVFPDRDAPQWAKASFWAGTAFYLVLLLVKLLLRWV